MTERQPEGMHPLVMTQPFYFDESVTLWHGDALAVLMNLPAESVNCIITSPPYFGLRDYGVQGQYGLESSPVEYVETMRALFAEARRVLAGDGTLWLNLGDSYQSSGGKEGVGPNAVVGSTRRQEYGRTRPTSGLPSKNLLGIPWRVAFALQEDSWILRNDIIWHKSNGMPSSARDRLATKHEHLFMFAKRARYWFDLDEIRQQVTSSASNKYEPCDDGKNPGDVWTIPTQPFAQAHFACMPVALAERCVKAGCKPEGVVLDPFSGSGTTGQAAVKHARRYVGIDLNADYLNLSLRTRLAQGVLT